MALANAAVNSILADEPWARERLAAHAGRTFVVRVGPLTSGFSIEEHGALANAPLAGATPDLVLTLSPLHVAPFLADPKRWNEFVMESGDVALGGTLKELAETLPWFVERLCARTFGPIIGQRIADTGRRMLEMPQYAATRITANVGAYARDEVQVLAHPSDMRKLAEQATELAGRIDALGARIGALEVAVPHGPVSLDAA